MVTLSLACAFAVCAVLLVAAASKLRSPAQTRVAARELGVGPWLAPFIAPVELAIAGLLLARPALGALCAVALLLTFTILLVRVVRSGRTVHCGCFGAAATAPVNAVTVLRNVGLVGASGFAGFATPVVGTGTDEILASACVGLGILSAGLLLLALAELRRTTGAVFSSIRIEA